MESTSCWTALRRRRRSRARARAARGLRFDALFTQVEIDEDRDLGAQDVGFERLGQVVRGAAA